MQFSRLEKLFSKFVAFPPAVAETFPFTSDFVVSEIELERFFMESAKAATYSVNSLIIVVSGKRYAYNALSTTLFNVIPSC